MKPAMAAAGGAGILILAAGRSRRFNGDKRLARLPGRDLTVLEATVSAARKSGLPVRVCLREGDDALARSLARDGVASVLCERANEGMGATLAEAVAVVSGWEAVLIALGDMPMVKASTYQALARACSRAGIAAPCYRGRRGNPVCFGAAWLDPLRQSSGDRGARDLLAAHPHSVKEVDVDDAGILRDVDYPADLDAMR